MASVTGTVKDASGNPAARILRAYRRSDGVLVGDTYTGPADASYASVVALLTGDGADGAQTCIDRSPTPKVVTFGGDAKISTAQRKFAAGSFSFDGTGDYLSIPRSSDTAFETDSAFTLEAWIYRTASSVAQGIFSSRPSAGTQGFVLRINANNTLQAFYTGGSSVLSVATVPANQWSHVAFARNGATGYLFIDGVLAVSGAYANGTVSTEPMRIGVESALIDSGFTGYMSGIRLTKDVARYTATFTPPTDRHPVRATGALGDYSFTVSTVDEITLLALDSATTAPIFDDVCERVIPA